MAYLLKTEPDKYSWDDLVRDGETVWDGITNNQALLNLRSMKKGEKTDPIYHSNVGKAAVGTATVVSVDATDPRAAEGRSEGGETATDGEDTGGDEGGQCLRGFNPAAAVPPFRGAAYAGAV